MRNKHWAREEAAAQELANEKAEAERIFHGENAASVWTEERAQEAAAVAVKEAADLAARQAADEVAAAVAAAAASRRAEYEAKKSAWESRQAAKSAEQEAAEGDYQAKLASFHADQERIKQGTSEFRRLRSRFAAGEISEKDFLAAKTSLGVVELTGREARL